MFDNLTKEQEELMDVVVNEYTSTKSINKEELDKGLEFIYELSGMAKPDNILIFDSPIKMFRYYLGNKDKHPIHQRSYIADKLYVAFPEHQIGTNVSTSLQERIDKGVRQKVRMIQTRSIRQAESELHVTGGLISEVMLSDWISYRDFFNRIGALDDRKFTEYMNYIKHSGVFIGMYFNDLAMVSKNPILVLKDEKNKPHNTEGPAVQWADGYSQYYAHGVSFEKELFDDIFINKTITPNRIVNLRNAEQKVLAIQAYGYDKLISELNAKKLDEWKTKSLVNGNVAICELYEFELDDSSRWNRNVYRFVKVQDHSTGKVTTLAVPVEEGTSTAKGAVAWTFGMSEKEYNPEIET